MPPGTVGAYSCCILSGPAAVLGLAVWLQDSHRLLLALCQSHQVTSPLLFLGFCLVNSKPSYPQLYREEVGSPNI